MMSKQLICVILSACSSSLLPGMSTYGELIPRTPLPKNSTIALPTFDYILQVKFRDDLLVRATSGTLVSLVEADLSNVGAVTTQYDLTYEQTIQLPTATLNSIESRASQRSGVSQPDLAGMVDVAGSSETIEAAAQALLALDEVEYAAFSERSPDPPCADIVPLTPDYFGPGLQSYHHANPGLNMSCAWAYGGRGQGIQIADCEFGFNKNHEDLCVCEAPNDPAGCNVYDS